VKNLFQNFIYLLIGITFVGCATLYEKQYDKAKESYNNGIYNQAVTYCLLSLKNNPDSLTRHEVNILLENAYKKAIEKKLNDITRFKNERQKFFWDDIYSSYNTCIQFNYQITDYNLEVNGSLKSLLRSNEEIFYKEIYNARINAAEQHYVEGKRFSNFRDTDNQKNAFFQFSTVLNYIPDYKDAQVLYDISKRNAVKRIAILPFEDKTNKRGYYGGLPDNLVDNIVALILNDPNACEFTEIITRDQINKVINEQKMSNTDFFDQSKVTQVGKLLGVHEIIVGKITQIIYSPEQTSQQTISETTEVVIDRKPNGRDKDSNIVYKNIMGTVRATVIKFRKNSYSQINGSFNIIDVETGVIKKSGSCSGKDDFYCEFATYRGDNRAVSYQNEILCNKIERFAPVEDQLISNAVDDLSKQLYSIIREYLK
jgi:hypothetical protein